MPAIPPLSAAAAVPLSLIGRSALVTGGSRGIGAATVRSPRRRSPCRLQLQHGSLQAEALAAELNNGDAPDAVFPLQQRLHSAGDGRALVEASLAALGSLDLLVVNHGVWPAHDQPINTMPEAQWTSTLAINLESVFGLVQATAAHLLAQPRPASAVRGHMVLVASTAAQRGEAFHADYAASKGALLSLTKSLSSELAPQGILVNCVAPGWVATEMSAAALEDPVTRGKATSLIPLGRVGSVEEIAGPILFLCTPFAGFISGEVLNVNGGAVLVG